MKKLCKKCKKELEISMFHKWKYGKDGLQDYCIVCKSEVNRVYCSNNRDKRRALISKWVSKNRARYNKMCRGYYYKFRYNIIEKYGSVCVCCGENDVSVLEFDHINNDGLLDRKKYKSIGIYHHIANQNFPKDKYQLLCTNCNLAKKLNNGKIPEWRNGLYNKQEVFSEQESCVW